MINSIFSNLKKGDFPSWLPDRIHYLTQMGSHAYGVAGPDSDLDIYGFAIPGMDVVFPHTAGNIQDFDKPVRFEQWQSHHIEYPDTNGETNELDISVYGIVKYFTLLMGNNPNIIDSIYAPQRCVYFESEVAKHLRSKRDIFLHKGSWHTFKGYAYSQLKKTTQNVESEKRLALIEQFGFDVKKGYHLVRLMREAEQILKDHTLVLDANVSELKDIREGKVSWDEINKLFLSEEIRLEGLYKSSKLRHSPDTVAVKKLLIECLEIEFGSLKGILG